MRPEIYSDIFILNNSVMILYSFYSKALYLYALIPLAAIWKIFWLARSFCCPPKANIPEEPEKISNKQKKREEAERKGVPVKRTKVMK